MARQWKPPRPETRCDVRSELEFSAQLQRARTVISGDLAEVAVFAIQVNVLGVGVVKRIEGLEPQFDSRPRFGLEWNRLEERQIPVLDSGSDHRVFAGVPEALVGATGPWGNRIGKRAGAEPSAGTDLLRIGNLGNLVGTVGSSAA